MLTETTTALRDGTAVRIVPYHTVDEAPQSVVRALHTLFNEIIEEGRTYPQESALTLGEFTAYYFSHFVAVMYEAEKDAILGCFYIKPNYPGRSAHVCNGGFLVASGARGRGVGSALGAQYVVWAPALGYRSSVFNLVYASNTASRRIWERLGFRELGRVPAAGRLRGEPELVDAVLYGYTFAED